MPTTTPPVVVQAETPLSLDERLALAHLAMDERLAVAHAAIAVDTAHIDIPPLPPITQPVEAPAPPCPYTTPVAQLLHYAHARLQAGWCTGTLRDEAGAVCLLGALR